ncbi:hypothetical protein GCM10011579_056510 [Streptomyces albiflavescens]|uniref:CHAT domain-containing protein n=1 Tax=Streptomyces albiflavescens TaxID=1623582 RepID=A0A918D6R0_9ACTN|nr:hypothetical protein [Streptomyces albiflavescens]GGN75959.1 hypothetical protein GCM10011579_056510 [Streptomyces albiflavescens]
MPDRPPGDREVLAVELEKERLGSALEELRRDGLIELGWVGGETGRDLRAVLRPGHGPWHVLHFIGHGGLDRVAKEGTLRYDAAEARWCSVSDDSDDTDA